MKAIEKAAKIIIKQQEFVMHLWMFMSVVTIASYFVIHTLWPDTDPFYPFLYGLPVVFMLSRSNKWETGFWSGFNGRETVRTSKDWNRDDMTANTMDARLEEVSYAASLEDNLPLDLILVNKRFCYQALAVLIGILIASNYVELIAGFSFLVWPFLVISVWHLGEAIGQESGFKTGWYVRPTELTEHILDDV